MNFQKQILELANGICLLDCYLTLGGIETFEDKLEYVRNALTEHIVGEDGWVNDANKLYDEVLGQNKKVYKSYEYHKDNMVVACWDNKHFTIVQNGKIVYDPMGPRDNPYKNITSYRIVEDK